MLSQAVRIAARAAALAAACGCASGCGPAPGELTVVEGEALGTRFRVQVADALDPAESARVSDRIASVLAEVDARLSTWRGDSELEAFNRRRSTEPVPLSQEAFGVLALAAEVSARSRGAFDVTVGPLVDAWGFGPAGEVERSPDEAAVASLLARTGWRLLELDAADRTARKASPDLRCDLSAIGKGHAVDRIALALEELGLRRYLIEIGGELRAGGPRPGGAAWRVAVERPDGSGEPSRLRLDLVNGALATSGDYRRFREEGGRRLAHVLDPRTGRPIEHATASVVVRHERCALADAWATALLVLGHEEGRRVAEEQGLAALFLVRDETGGFVEHATSAWSAARPA